MAPRLFTPARCGGCVAGKPLKGFDHILHGYVFVALRGGPRRVPADGIPDAGLNAGPAGDVLEQVPPCVVRRDAWVGHALVTHPGGDGLFVGFSDDRRLAVLVWFGIAVFVLGIMIIVVGVSRRHRVAHDGDDAPVEQPGGNVLDACGHFDSCWTS